MAADDSDSDAVGTEPDDLEDQPGSTASQVNVEAWRRRAQSALPPGLTERAQARHVGIPFTSYRAVMKSKLPSLAQMVRFHESTDFALPEQLSVLWDIDVRTTSPREPLWRPRISAEHLVESLQHALYRSQAVAPSVIDLGEAVIRSCRETGDLARWRIRHFDVPGGWRFPHVAFEAVEFMRWYGPDNGVDEDLWASRAEEYLGVSDETVPLQRWERFLTPAQLTQEEPPKAFEPHETTARRRAHWRQFRFERAELNQRTETLRHAARTGWIGGYGTLHTPLLRHSAAATGRHILIQPVVRPLRVRDPQLVPVAEKQNVRTVILLGTAAVSIHNLLGNWIADGLGWSWVSLEELDHRFSGRRPPHAVQAQREMLPSVLSAFSQAPFPRTVLTAALGALTPLPGPKARPTRRMQEAEELLVRPDVLPILVRPTDDTLALWEERQALASPEGRYERQHRHGRALELYSDWEQFLTSVPGSILAEMSATLPWAGDAVIPPAGATGPGSTHRLARNAINAAWSAARYLSQWGHHDDGGDPEDGQEVPAYYQHPLIGDMILQVAYEIAWGLRQPAGISAVRRGHQPTPRTAKPTSRTSEMHRRPDKSPARPIGFADGSLLDRHEVSLMRSAARGQWTGEDHLAWNDRYDQPAPDDLPGYGRLLRIRLLGPALGLGADAGGTTG